MGNEALWNQYYELATQYYQEHGNLNVPYNYVVNEMPLGKWISRQRSLKTAGDLSPEKIRKLEAIKMSWDMFEEKWNQYYELATQYYQKHGDLNIPREYIINGVRLGDWIERQRLAKKGIGTATITNERIEKLNKIGMKWETRKFIPLAYKPFSGKDKYYIRRRMLINLEKTLLQFNQERLFTSIEDVKAIEEEFVKKLK